MLFRPLSAYATQAVRAYGSLGVVPDDDKDFRGLNIAEFALMKNGEKLRAPCFVHLYYTNGKRAGKTETSPFMLLAILHLPGKGGKPDIPVVYGCWCVDKDGPESNFFLWCDAEGILKQDADSDKAFKAMGKGNYLLALHWEDTAPLNDVDAAIVVCRRVVPLTLQGDPGVVAVSAVLRYVTYGKAQKKQYLKIDPLPDDYTIDSVLDMMLDRPKWLEFADPAPVTGLLPREPSFEKVSDDAAWLNERVYRFGAVPGGLVHACVYRTDVSMRERVGVITGYDRSAGLVALRELRPLPEVMAPSEGPYLPGRSDDELVLTRVEYVAKIAQLRRPVLLLSERALHAAGLDAGADVRELNYFLDEAGDLKVIAEPQTALQGGLLSAREAGEGVRGRRGGRSAARGAPSWV